MIKVVVVVLAALCAVLAVVAVVLNSKSHESFMNSSSFDKNNKRRKSGPRSRVAIASVMYNPVDVGAWLDHHRALGVVRFYVRLEDSPSQVEYLSSAEDVFLERGHRDRDGSNNNYFTVMDRQKRFVDLSMEHAVEAGDIDFVFHIDSDELIVGDLSVLDRLPAEIKCVNVKNAEAVYDGSEEGCFDSTRFRMCDIESNCRSYINGKGAGRAEAGVGLSGPHAFSYEGATRGKNHASLEFDDIGILHFDSCSFASWSQKFQNMISSSSSSSSSMLQDDEIPFRFYHDSIEAAAGAYEVYKKYVMIEEGSSSDVVEIEHFVGEEGECGEEEDYDNEDDQNNALAEIVLNVDPFNPETYPAEFQKQASELLNAWHLADDRNEKKAEFAMEKFCGDVQQKIIDNETSISLGSSISSERS